MSDQMDPRVRRTRQFLEEAFTSLIGEKTYGDVTVKEIAARASVNRATFYAHFVDKEDLYRYFLQRSFERELGENVKDRSPTSVQDIDSLLRAVFQYVNWLTGMCRSATKTPEMPLPEAYLQEQLEEMFFCWIQETAGESREESLPADLLAIAISSAVVAIARDWSRQLERSALEEMVGQVRTMIVALLGVHSQNP